MKNKMKVEFEHLGYFLEYMSGSTYLGCANIDEPDRETTGYYSRIDAIAETDIQLGGNKVIKKGTHYFTRMNSLCGKWVNKPDGFMK